MSSVTTAVAGVMIFLHQLTGASGEATRARAEAEIARLSATAGTTTDTHHRAA